MLEVIDVPPGRCGHCWHSQPGGRLHGWHRHAQPEINLVLRGRAHYLLADRSYQLGPGSLVWLFPEQEHRLVDLSADYAMWIAIIDHRILAAHAGQRTTLVAGNPEGHFACTLRPTDHRFLSRLCDDLSDNAIDDDRFNCGLTYAFLCAWDAYREADQADHTTLHPAIEQILSLLDHDPELGVAELAQAVGLSRSHCSRLFQRQLGQSLTAYRTKLRLERFRALLEAEDERPLLTLALEAGFGSYAQFHRAVHLHWGCSPSALHSRLG